MTQKNSLPSLDILFDSPLWAKSRLSARQLTRLVLDVTWDSIPRRPKGVCPALTVILTNDSKIRTLNREYRGKDKPTNVLSFPMFDSMGEIPAGAGDIPLGDIFISFETIRQEAKEQGKSLNNHYTHMLIHGFLHLLGYDHMSESEAKSMESLEIRILKKFSIANPYL
jgi:probable rRNA maturation factor